MAKREIFKGTVGELKSIAKDNGMFEYDYFDDIKDLMIQIKDCEGKHIQQVSFSTYHKALTQVCFGCKKVRTMINTTMEVRNR